MHAVFWGLPVLQFLSIATGNRVNKGFRQLQTQLTPKDADLKQVSVSQNISACPGYALKSLEHTAYGLSARLTLAGPACNVFGQDIVGLTVDVTYESQTRLHVNIYDTEGQQYTIPQSVISLPSPPTISFQNNCDLVFNFDPKPFAFWITRRSRPVAAPLFDTRVMPLRQAPIAPTKNSGYGTSEYPLVFENQYMQLTSTLPLDANIYGLGEVVASSGFRRDVGATGTAGTTQTMWARGASDPIDQNIYGSHYVYLEHRFDAEKDIPESHGVFLRSAAGADIILDTPAGSNTSLVQYRLIGGTLDLYFFSGPSPLDVIEQYGALIGLPTWQPIWGFGFQLCRWGYHDINDTREQVQNMRKANIPLEVMWNDIDLYHAFRDFTSDPVTFPSGELREFIDELTINHQKYIPIVDADIPKQVNASDIYDPYTRGVEQKVFITNPDGTEYVGLQRPGYTVYPDWFANTTQQWWTDALRNWSKSGIEFAGIWLDLNEASSSCDGSCGTGANLTNVTAPTLPGEPGNLITDYPECYNASVFGPSGNVTVNGTLTCDIAAIPGLQKRGLGAGHQTGVNLNTPPYAIHNGAGRLSIGTLATNATHVNGVVELDVHNMWGLMEERATHLALQELFPGKRPFLISRSTFASAGKWTGHWLGDNFSKWQSMRFSIQGVLQFQLFQIPFVGADACGFNGHTDEELCNRWMQLAAFTPFFRNHNVRGALSQEPYRWDSVAEASRAAIAVRYALLPYWYTLFANASTRGTPPVRALFFEFPDEPELFGIDTQFLIGKDILVTPVLTPNATTVDGIFPGRRSVTWRDWYTHAAVFTLTGTPTTLSAPLGHVNVHVRDRAALLLHAAPAYTVAETQAGPFALLVTLAEDGTAFGTAYLDDGVSSPPGANRSLTFSAAISTLRISGTGSFHVASRLQNVTVLGVAEPTQVALQSKDILSWTYDKSLEKLVVSGVNINLNADAVLTWE